MVHPVPTEAVRRAVSRAIRTAPPIDVPSAASREDPPERDELAALRVAGRTSPDDPAERARRSAAAYLAARRVRLRRELRDA